MSGKVKVCHFTSIHPAGDTRIFVKECSSLSKAGYDVYLVAVNTEDKIINGVHVINVPVQAGGRLHRMTSVAYDVFKKALSLDADIYHFHDPELIPFALRLIAKGKRVIYDVHEDIPRQILAKYYIPKLFRGLISGITESIENYAARKFSWIITATPHIRDRFLKFNKQVTDVCNFPVRNELTNTTSYKLKPRQICYVGSITRARGILELVEAMEGLPYELHLCGEFSPLSLRNEAMKLGGWKNVVEHGYASREQVKSVLENSRAGMVTLHPIINYIDAYPVKMFEYMLAGLPVIASNIPLWNEIVDKASAGYCVDPLKPSEIKEAIVKIMENEQASEIMGRNGKAAVELNYNWTREEIKLLDIYKQLSN